MLEVYSEGVLVVGLLVGSIFVKNLWHCDGEKNNGEWSKTFLFVQENFFTGTAAILCTSRLCISIIQNVGSVIQTKFR